MYHTLIEYQVRGRCELFLFIFLVDGGDVFKWDLDMIGWYRMLLCPQLSPIWKPVKKIKQLQPLILISNLDIPKTSKGWYYFPSS